MSVYIEYRACSNDGFCGWVVNPYDGDNDAGFTLIGDNGETRHIPIEDLKLDKNGATMMTYAKLYSFVDAPPPYFPPQNLNHPYDYSRSYQLGPLPAGISEEIRVMPRGAFTTIEKKFVYRPKLPDAFPRGLAECFKSKDNDALLTCLANLKKSAANLYPQQGQEGWDDGVGLKSYECFGLTGEAYQNCVGNGVPDHTNGDL